ncbi:uncharacterized protein TNCV_2342241 [Trichonephila clavipes]|nr:uncharacterized protein TNCV_2342241 [Trichonephila clavipes]
MDLTGAALFASAAAADCENTNDIPTPGCRLDPGPSRWIYTIKKIDSVHVFTCRNCGGGDRVRVAIYRPFGDVSLSLNRTVTCMVLKANDRRTSCPCHDKFRGPRSDYVRQGYYNPMYSNNTANNSPDSGEVSKIVPSVSVEIHDLSQPIPEKSPLSKKEDIPNPKMARQPRGPRPTVSNSVYVTLGSEVHEQMFRSNGQSDTKPPVLSSQTSLVLIYRPSEGMKG